MLYKKSLLKNCCIKTRSKNGEVQENSDQRMVREMFMMCEIGCWLICCLFNFLFTIQIFNNTIIGSENEDEEEGSEEGSEEDEDSEPPPPMLDSSGSEAGFEETVPPKKGNNEKNADGRWTKPSSKASGASSAGDTGAIPKSKQVRATSFFSSFFSTS